MADLSRLQVALVEGMPVTVYMDSDETNDLEADAVVFFDRDRAHWCAELTTDDVRQV